MSRKVLILANVGNRDVLCKGEELRPAREKGAEVLENFNKAVGDIALPIVSPAIKHIGSSVGWASELSGGAAPTVGLFYTDQDDPRHRQNDTVEFAKIMQRKLLQEFSKRNERGGVHFPNKKSILTIPVRQSPARYDDMYSFYRDFFSGNPHLREPGEWLCFVLTSGGTPAMNAMLILHAVQHFGENCVQIYVSPEGEAYDMRVGEEIVRAATERRFNEALAASQFRAAAEILGDGTRGGHRASVCRYAEHRLAFDFRGADVHCRDALRQAEGEARKWLEEDSRLAQRLEHGASNQALLIEELFYNLEVKWFCGEYVDVLGRASRLAEALLTWMVERYTEIRTGERMKLIPDQDSAVDSVPKLRRFLESYRTDGGNRLELKREINRVALMAVTEHLATPDAELSEGDRSRAARTAEAAKSIESLAKLRNRTILAHGFEGVSRERLEAEYGSDSLIEDLRTSVGEALGCDLSTNPFSELAERLKF